MLVEKTEIEKAKEKLGDQNWNIITELLELDGVDEKNMKAICPYHNEDTPSFVYDKKTHRAHCFGCGTTVDVVDVLMEKGRTFLDATKFLFEKAGMSYSYGEQSVKTRSTYKYPHEESLNNDKSMVIDYWGKRGISKNVLDYLDVRADSYGNTVFNYYDLNDVLTMVKYRPSRSINKSESKNWTQKNADTTPLLFNMNRVNTSKPLVICEGEPDNMSIIEAGYLNCCSIPLGAQNTHWIEESWDFLEQFDDIIIWFDNDSAGEKARKEVMSRLGVWRCRFVDTPSSYKTKDGKTFKLKDGNDCLQVGGKEFVMKLINEAKDVPVRSVVDYSNIEELDMSKVGGIKTGIKPLDKEIDKLYFGTLTLLSGRPGSGKTSIIDQAIANTIDNGDPVFLFSKELPERMSAQWFNTIIAGRRNMVEKEADDGRKYYVVPYSKQAEMQAFYQKKLFIYKDDEPNDIDSVMVSAEECVRKFGCKFVVIDNLMSLDLNCNDDNKYEAQTELINRLIKFASKFNVAVCLVCHPRKVADPNADIDMYDISGSSNIINLAMRSFGLRRVSKREKEDPKCKWSKYDVVLSVMKDRLYGKSDIQLGLWYDNPSRRFYTDYSEFDYQYSWDKTTYTNKLSYIDRMNPAPGSNPFN